MNLVEIQVVCAQAFQGSFNLLLDGFLGETTFIEINLGCDNHVLSLDAEILDYIGIPLDGWTSMGVHFLTPVRVIYLYQSCSGSHHQVIPR